MWFLAVAAGILPRQVQVSRSVSRHKTPTAPAIPISPASVVNGAEPWACVKGRSQLGLVHPIQGAALIAGRNLYRYTRLDPTYLCASATLTIGQLFRSILPYSANPCKLVEGVTRIYGGRAVTFGRQEPGTSTLDWHRTPSFDRGNGGQPAQYKDPFLWTTGRCFGKKRRFDTPLPLPSSVPHPLSSSSPHLLPDLTHPSTSSRSIPALSPHTAAPAPITIPPLCTDPCLSQNPLPHIPRHRLPNPSEPLHALTQSRFLTLAAPSLL
jgi:hypothetical protein